MRKDRTGHKFGMLTAVEPGTFAHNEWRWLFRCDCGKTKDMFVHSAKTTRHCGCLTPNRLRRRFLKHGMAHTRLYKVWAGIKDRCNNPNNKFYSYYGGRGISICPRWTNSFQAFFNDMGEKPPGHTVERINVNGNYEPNNCRWATRKEQANNQRRHVISK